VSRILIDPAELAALSALCRNTSYDVAGVATEARHRMDHLVPLIGASAASANALVDVAITHLHRIAAELDDDALALASFGQQGAAADALGTLGGNEHSLLNRLQQHLGESE
jgi:hypothetical protein